MLKDLAFGYEEPTVNRVSPREGYQETVLRVGSSLTAAFDS